MSRKKLKEREKGAIVSYVAVVLQFLVNMFITPMLIKALGLNEYGLYETINSFGTSLLTLNFGIHAIVSRSIVKEKKNKCRLENFLATSAIVSAAIFVLILVVGFIASMFITPLYEHSLDPAQITKAKLMFIYIVINLAVMSWHNFTSGIIYGHEKFVFGSSTRLIRQLVRVSLLLILMNFSFFDAVTIVIIDLVATIVLLATEVIYCLSKLKVPIKIHKVDKKDVKEISLFSLASLLQTITNHINLTLDKVILGIMMTTTIVAKYSIGLLINNVMVSVLQIISTLYMPEATKLVLRNADGEELTDLIIKPGRIQNIIGCGIVFGFAVVGKLFLGIWVGEEFEEIWGATMLILVVTMVSYTTSVANVVLDAMLKKMYRSVILIIAAVINVIITVILVPIMGYMGAALGTAISMIIGNIVLLNVYLKKRVNINISRMYIEIAKGILPSAAVSALIVFMIPNWSQSDIGNFVIKASVFVLLYGISLLLFGLNNDERAYIRKKS